MIDAHLLHNIAYFTGLAQGNRALDDLAQATIQAMFERGQLLFLEGEGSRGIYYLRQGRVRLYRSGEGGREQVMQLVRAGATFNEVAVLDGKPTLTNAEALETCEVLIIPTQAMLNVIDREPAVAKAIISNLAARVRDLTTLAADMSLKHVTARVAHLLLTHVQEEAILGVGLRNEVTAQLTQQQMAAMAGTVREMIGRALRTLQKAGAIEARRGYIVIKNTAILQDFL